MRQTYCKVSHSLWEVRLEKAQALAEELADGTAHPMLGCWIWLWFDFCLSLEPEKQLSVKGSPWHISHWLKGSNSLSGLGLPEPGCGTGVLLKQGQKLQWPHLYMALYGSHIVLCKNQIRYCHGIQLFHYYYYEQKNLIIFSLLTPWQMSHCHNKMMIRNWDAIWMTMTF